MNGPEPRSTILKPPCRIIPIHIIQQGLQQNAEALCMNEILTNNHFMNPTYYYTQPKILYTVKLYLLPSKTSC